MKTFGGKGSLAGAPSKKVAIVGCMDARFHLEKALGLEEGDAHIIRNAGRLWGPQACTTLLSTVMVGHGGPWAKRLVSILDMT